MTNGYALCALQFLVNEDGTTKEMRSFVRSYDGKVIDFKDASDGTKAAVIQRVRDWLEVVDP